LRKGGSDQDPENIASSIGRRKKVRAEKPDWTLCFRGGERNSSGIKGG